MKWSLIGKAILKLIPTLVETAQRLKKPGADKKQVVMDEIQKELAEYSPQLAQHPRVIEAIGKVNDAVVDAHNVITEVEASINPSK